MANTRLTQPTIQPRAIAELLSQTRVGTGQFFSMVRARISQAHLGIQVRRFGSREAYELENAMRDFRRKRRCVCGTDMCATCRAQARDIFGDYF